MEISFYSKLVGNGLKLISTIAMYTARLQVTGMEYVEALNKAGYPLLWTAWHGQTMMLCGFMRQKLVGRRATFLIPDDWRGETLYQFLAGIGMRPHPVDLENRGLDTARKVAQLVRIIKKESYDNFIAPDGPAGPSYEIKPGIFFISQKVGAPILPIGAYGRHVYEVNRWDAYALPYPFCRLSIAIGEPLHLPSEMVEDEKKFRLKAALHEVSMKAKANYYSMANRR